MGEIDVTAFVADLVPAMTRRVPYRPPDDDEAAALEALAAALGRGETAGVASLGLEATFSGDTLVLASDPTSDRAWLVVVLRPGVVPDVVVEVPHPNADLDTELVGLSLRDRRAGALLLQAGAHRIAGAPPEAVDRIDCPADVSSRADAPFSRVASVLTARGLPQIQLHGFADRDGVDAVLSPGAAGGGPLLDAVEARLRAAGERVGTGEDPRWADLLGRRNVQGLDAAACGAAFVHLELSRSLRRDPGRREAVAAALAGALDDVLGVSST
ncbi:hypothetical protein [Actinomycetospora callitridis]|uniref:hypothetical protein n=1 Tax=Actinomycetospora callitridis TaxID=913944 RepID=UPI0023651BED|nr:hypothetical protein [Actinomycetospora callitridis]MDD7917743.1 hypothetical protein [Actinomycetospora callitridis]